jgi:hypothetical protein
MIHVATVHWKLDFFIDLQHRLLEKYLGPCKIWAFLDNIEGIKKHQDKYFFAEDSGIQPGVRELPVHGAKLHLLVKKILAHPDTVPTDIIVFIDGDAWPINPLRDFIGATLEKFSMAAVIREENGGDRQPHPSFCFMSIAFWEKYNLNWCYGLVDNPNFPKRQDVGGCMLQTLKQNGIKWHKIRRSRSRGEHPVLFGDYGDLIYHHGAGYRSPLTMADQLHKGIQVSRKKVVKFFEEIKGDFV